MTVPGVNVICAATVLAAVGDIRRFRTSSALVGYLGLDPRVRQSGNEPAKGGRISKRGSSSARWVLVEAAWSVVQQPGPLRAFYQRLRARRGHGKAIVAVARKLAVLFWCLLIPRRGLRPPAALADRQKAAAGRDHRRRPDPAGQADRRVRHARAYARGRTRARPAGRGLLHTDGLRLASRQATEDQARATGKGGRERDSGARTKALEGQRRAADHEPLTSALRHVLDSRPPPRLTAHRPREHADSRRRRPRAAENRPNHADRPPSGRNRGHRSRSKRLRDPPATDPTPEIEPENAPRALDFHRSSTSEASMARRRRPLVAAWQQPAYTRLGDVRAYARRGSQAV